MSSSGFLVDVEESRKEQDRLLSKINHRRTISRKATAKYTLKHLTEKRLYSRCYYKRNKAYSLAYAKLYRQNNKEGIREKDRIWLKKNLKKKEAYQRQWRQKNIERARMLCRRGYKKLRTKLEFVEKEKQRQKIYSQAVRRDVLLHYSHSRLECACCKEREYNFLTLHHTNNNGREKRQTIGIGTRFYRYLKIHNYPDGYAVLCMNCNFALGICGFCPHQRNIETQKEVLIA